MFEEVEKEKVMNNSKQGFTLAEVLVTLAIIGVVAALTIPTLIQSANQAKYSTGLKKTISVLSSALQMNVANNIDLTAITPNSDTALAAYFSSQLNVLTDDAAGTLSLADGSKLHFKGSPGVNTVGCTDADTDGICDAGQGAMSGLPVGLTGAVCPNITPSMVLPASGYCMIYVDVNGGKLPNIVSTNTSNNDIYLLGVDSTGVKSVDGTNVTIPDTFASVAASPGQSSINALTQ